MCSNGPLARSRSISSRTEGAASMQRHNRPKGRAVESKRCLAKARVPPDTRTLPLTIALVLGETSLDVLGVLGQFGQITIGVPKTRVNLLMNGSVVHVGCIRRRLAWSIYRVIRRKSGSTASACDETPGPEPVASIRPASCSSVAPSAANTCACVRICSAKWTSTLPRPRYVASVAYLQVANC